LERAEWEGAWLASNWFDGNQPLNETQRAGRWGTRQAVNSADSPDDEERLGRQTSYPHGVDERRFHAEATFSNLHGW
jgi:hypothetical protein